MATLTFELANLDVDRVVGAFEHTYGPRDDQVETKGEFLTRHMQLKINDLVRAREGMSAQRAANEAYIDLIWTDV